MCSRYSWSWHQCDRMEWVHSNCTETPDSSVLEHKTNILLLLVKYIVYIHQSSFTIINVHTVTQITVHINQQT